MTPLLIGIDGAEAVVDVNGELARGTGGVAVNYYPNGSPAWELYISHTDGTFAVGDEIWQSKGSAFVLRGSAGDPEINEFEGWWSGGLSLTTGSMSLCDATIERPERSAVDGQVSLAEGASDADRVLNATFTIEATLSRHGSPCLGPFEEPIVFSMEVEAPVTGALPNGIFHGEGGYGGGGTYTQWEGTEPPNLDPNRGRGMAPWSAASVGDGEYDHDFHWGGVHGNGTPLFDGTFVLDGQQFVLNETHACGGSGVIGERRERTDLGGWLFRDSGVITTVWVDCWPLPGTSFDLDLSGWDDSGDGIGTYTITYDRNPSFSTDPGGSVVSWRATFTAEAEACTDTCVSGPVELSLSGYHDGYANTSYTQRELVGS